MIVVYSEVFLKSQTNSNLNYLQKSFGLFFSPQNKMMLYCWNWDENKHFNNSWQIYTYICYIRILYINIGYAFHAEPLQIKHYLSCHPCPNFWLFAVLWGACKSSHLTKTSHVWNYKHLWFPSSLHLRVFWIALSNRTCNLQTKIFQFLYMMERHNMPSLMSLTGSILTPATRAEVDNLKAIYRFFAESKHFETVTL